MRSTASWQRCVARCNARASFMQIWNRTQLPDRSALLISPAYAAAEPYGGCESWKTRVMRQWQQRTLSECSPDRTQNGAGGRGGGGASRGAEGSRFTSLSILVCYLRYFNTLRPLPNPWSFSIRCGIRSTSLPLSNKCNEQRNT